MISLLLISALWLFLLAIAAYVYGSLPSWRLKHIPCPPYTWGIGHLPLLEKYQAEVFVKLAREYGPVYRFHAGRQPLVVVADPELFRELAVKKFKIAPDRSIPIFIETTPVLKKGLFFTRGSRWSYMRNVLLPSYHSEHLSQHIPVMHRLIGSLVKNLRSVHEQEDVNISEFFLKMTIDVVGEAAFGTKFGQLDNNVGSADADLVEASMKSVRSLRMDGGAPLSTIVATLCPILQHPVRKILCKIPGTADRQQETSNLILMKALEEVVERRRRDRTSWETRNHVDAISLLLKAEDDSKSAQKLLTADYVSALAFELLLTGSETSATTLSFLLYLVSEHPEVEKKLVEEIDAFGPPDRQPSFEDLVSFPYVEQVIKETMRLYSVTPVITREASQDMELGGYHLPKGTSVWMAPIAMYRDARNFEEPDKFMPERFSEESEENKRRHPYAYIPFGIGPRVCIGYRFAMQEMKMTVIRLYQSFTFTHSPAMEKPLALHFGLIIQPKFGVRLKVHPRPTPQSP